MKVMCNQRSREFKCGSTVESSQVLMVGSVVSSWCLILESEFHTVLKMAMCPGDILLDLPMVNQHFVKRVSFSVMCSKSVLLSKSLSYNECDCSKL